MFAAFNDDNIFKTNPPFTNRRNQREKGWTNSINGYIADANKLKDVLAENERISLLKCHWFVTVNFHRCVNPYLFKEQVVEPWKATCARLKRHNINGFWVIEPTKKNTVHYHIVIKNQLTKAELNEIFDVCLPKPNEVGGLHKDIKRVTPGTSKIVFGYMTKSKVSGWTKHGVYTTDLYKYKRLLFKPNLGGTKFGAISDVFWVKPKPQVWEDVKSYSKEKKKTRELVDSRLAHPDKTILAEYFADLTDIHLPKIRRKIALYWDAHMIDQCISNLKEYQPELFIGESYEKGLLKYRQHLDLEEGLNDPDVIRYAEYLHDLAGGDHAPLSLTQIKKNVAGKIHDPEVKSAIAMLKEEGNEFFAGPAQS